MRIISRYEWGARAPLRPLIVNALPWENVWLHHTDGKRGGAEVMRSVQALHQSTAVRGGPWRDIAYNFGVGDHEVFEGMGLFEHLNEDRGRSATIVLLGDFEDHHLPNEMIELTAWLLVHGYLSGWWKRPELAGGHRDLEPTACPGRHAYGRISYINSRARAILEALTTPQEDDDDMRTLLIRHPEGSIWLFNGETRRPANSQTYRRTLRFHGTQTPSMSLEVDDWFEWSAEGVESVPIADDVSSVLGALGAGARVSDVEGIVRQQTLELVELIESSSAPGSSSEVWTILRDLADANLGH